MDIDAGNSQAENLRAAAWNGNLEVVEWLVKQGADVNIWDKWGRTALSLAATNGHLEVVKFLVQVGAWVDPHEDYDTYETPLISAAENGRLEIVKLLCVAGANPRIHGGISQRTAASYARTNGHAELANYLRTMEEIYAGVKGTE